jgi:hypothetical protein
VGAFFYYSIGVGVDKNNSCAKFNGIRDKRELTRRNIEKIYS